MKISFVGSHGTGKTTTLSSLAELRPEWIVYPEASRHLIQKLGFQNAYEFVDLHGIGAYELVFLSHWSWLDPVYSAVVQSGVFLIDRSPIDNLAYYLLLRKDSEIKYESTLFNLAQYYMSFIDYYILFPTGIFQFEADELQRCELQEELQQIITGLLKKYSLPYFEIRETGVHERVHEILFKIETGQKREG